MPRLLFPAACSDTLPDVVRANITINTQAGGIAGLSDYLGTFTRTGSHNLVVGDDHEWTSYGGLVAGYTTTTSGSEDWAAGSLWEDS